MKKLIALACLATAVMFMAVVATFAQDAVVITQEPHWWDPIVPSAMILLGTIITALIGYASLLLKKSTGLDVEKKYKDFLQDALTNAVRSALQKTGWVPGDVVPAPQALAPAASLYLAASMPDTLKHFGIDRQDMGEITRLITPHMPTVNPSTAPTPAAKPTAQP